MRNKRQEKKNESQAHKFAEYVMWNIDFRAYLLEADFEGIPLSIIRNQFKRRIKRTPNFAVTTRMEQYVKEAMQRT